MAVILDSAKQLLSELSTICKGSEQVLAYAGLFFVGSIAFKFVCKIACGVRVHVWSRLWKKDLVGKYGRWAVVTGSTDGIGKAYARELARNGMNIMLVSRTLAKLDKVAQEIRKDFGVETDVVQADFSIGRPVYDDIAKHLKDKDIGILVNNVGMMVTPGLFDSFSENNIWSCVNVNVASVPVMTSLLLPKMLARKKGAIINISSSGANFPMPYLQLYAATKAFVTHFTCALQVEYAKSGVTIQCIEPAAVATPMAGTISGISQEGFFTATPDAFAANAVATLGYSKLTSGYWTHGIQVAIMKFVPQSFVHSYMRSLVEGDKKSK